ncbi:NAD(P)H oxidoreductase YRKL [Vibrio astriarenae]|nr:NAD(P)H oxidoreductase YRKL [Vibrio sp. C7]
MRKVIVISGHPDLNKSYPNSVILDELGIAFPDADIRRLDKLYPDFNINVGAEQRALQGADTIVFQFPYYWYLFPALMKKWIDDVFTFNFAYGPEGDKLKGKQLILSFTIGGPEQAYSHLVTTTLQ